MLKIKIKMNIKLLTIITVLSLCLITGFEKKSYSLSNISKDNISALKILNYLPKDNKAFFISNTKSSKITTYLRKNYETKNQDDLVLIKNSILAYLGIDLGTNKLEDIYNNELIITTYNNKEKEIDDILIIFKIKEKKDIDDVLNLTNKVDEPEKMINIFRENKLNYLKYIYRTKDNYIMTSSNKDLILDAIKSSKNIEKIGKKYIPYTSVLNNFKNEHNILLTRNFRSSELLNYENYPLTKDDYLLTLFNLEKRGIVLKSYLVNNTKNLDIMSYEKIDEENILDNQNYQISIFNNFSNSKTYLDHVEIDNFEKAMFKELNEKLRQNIILLISDKNWLIIFDKNNLSIEKIKLLEDFNKNSLENNNNIYTIYSKDILKKEEDIIKQSNFKNIFSIQSENLTFISNSLIAESDIDLISRELVKFKGESYDKYFLNKKINLKNLDSIQPKNFSYIEKINYFFQNTINLSVIEFKAIIKQSIPEIKPKYYTKTYLKIF